MVVLVIVLSAFRSSIADYRIFVNKLAYDLKVPFTQWRIAEWSAPQRGDIVVFFSPVDGKRLVKRVVGLGGDIIEMRNDRLWINGSPVEYERPGLKHASKLGFFSPHRQYFLETFYGHTHPVSFTRLAHAKRTFAPVTIPQGHYFMLGDNRDESFDSRYFGPVDRRLIVGQSAIVVFSLDRGDYWLPRTDRFFRKLP
jgi:signal peptidase I